MTSRPCTSRSARCWVQTGVHSRHGPGIQSRLISLLEEAVERAKATVGEKNPNLDPATLARRAAEVGIGAVKYADLSTGRTRDYIFDLDRMVSLHGNTGVYLQYAYARVQSILRKVPAEHADVHQRGPAARTRGASARHAARHLDEALSGVRENFEPHRLCSYLYNLAQAFTEFYEACPVLKAPTEALAANRIALCQLMGSTLKLGLELLGIAAPDRL